MGHRRGRIAVAALATVIWIAAPVAAVGVITWQLSQVELTPEEPVWVEATPSEKSVSTQQALMLTWSPSDALIAPAWEGVVQRVLVKPGSVIESGQPVVEISGTKRLAVASTIPFSRVLDRGDQGEDVSQFNSVARSLGFQAPDGDKFTRESGLAAAALYREISGRETSGPVAFDPAWFIFLPNSTIAGELHFTVGGPAPSQGEKIVIGRDKLVSAQVVSPAVLESANAQDDYNPATDLDPADLVSVPPSNQLRVGETSLQLADDRTSVQQADVELLSTLVQPGARGVPAFVVSPTETGQWLVPTTAVIVDSKGKSCVLVQKNDGFVPRDAVVTAQADANVVVTVDMNRGDRVAVAPPARYRSCK